MANWDDIMTEGNVEDRRGTRPAVAFAGAGGIVVLLLTLGLNYLGLNITQSTVESALNTIQSLNAGQAKPTEQSPEFKGDDSYEVFTKKVLGSTDAVWTEVFGQNGLNYEKPRLVLFREATQSGCGVAVSQVGPHYCPEDSTIYLDETFFEELRARFGGSVGEVAQAYVIAHEVGHGVQKQLGVFNNGPASSASESVAIELQADCYAGVWAYTQAQRGLFEAGDIDQALSAAAAVGDDNVQKATQGYSSPETWTHGSSAQRVNAFNVGYTTGQPAKCTNLQS